MRFCDHVADLVHSAANKVHELKFGDRTHAGQGRSKSRANNRRFRDWRVNHALGTEPVNKAIGDLECAAVNTDVLAEAENRRVALHLFPNSLADGFKIGQLRHNRKKVYYYGRSYVWLGLDIRDPQASVAR